MEHDEGMTPWVALTVAIALGGVLLGVHHYGWLGLSLPWPIAIPFWLALSGGGAWFLHLRGAPRAVSAWLVVGAIVLALLLPFGWMEAAPRT